MTQLFGYCLSADGAKPDQYHGACTREYVDTYGITHVCGCPNHELDNLGEATN